MLSDSKTEMPAGPNVSVSHGYPNCAGNYGDELKTMELDEKIFSKMWENYNGQYISLKLVFLVKYVLKKCTTPLD